MFLIDRQFLNKLILECLLKKINAFILMCEVNIKKHFINNYLLLDIYIKEQVNSKNAITYIR